jgi:outer membrane murein-binding lipoprotein Lpp
MSKKLIAVASAAALALAGLVAIPTVATAAGVGPFAVTATGAATNQTVRDGSTATKAIQINVPSDDVLRSTASTDASTVPTNSTAIKFAVTTPGATDTITVSSTGGVKLLTATQFAATTTTSATGTQTLSVPAAGGDADVYAYTTTTAGGTVVLSAAGSSKTYNIVGLSTTAYKMNFTQGASAPLEGKFTLTGTVKDAFGNDLTTALAFGDFNITILGGSAAATKAAVATANFKYTSATKTYTITGNVRDTAGSQAVVLDIGNRLIAGTKVTAFGDPVVEQFFTVTANDLATQVTALTAQVAALTADYNALAAKWNARVASKKAPKKAVATK